MLKVAFFTSVPNWWYDTVSINKNHVLFPKIPTRLFIKKEKKKTLRIDHYIGYMIQHTCSSFAIVEMITPQKMLKMNKSDFKQYDVIVNQFLSPLAVFQSYGTKADRQYRNLLNSHITKVYPSVAYTNFVEDKCVYTNVLKKAGFPVADSFCITRKAYMNLKTHSAKDKFVQQTMDTADRKGWDTIFAKPILGTGSWGTKVFDTTKKSTTRAMQQYIHTSFEKKQYPKLMFQENHPEFGTSSYEIRMVFVGDEYKYTVMNDVHGNWEMPIQEGGKESLPQLGMLKKMSHDIIHRVIKPLIKSPKNYELLETRIDYGCCVGHQMGKYFVNEVEYAGGLMTFMDKNSFGIHDALAKQLKKIIRSYIS
jgi:hypothetical protein